MKRTLTLLKIPSLLLLLLIVQSSFGQSPLGFHYQTVVRDGSGLVKNQTIQLKFSILENGAFPAAYQETHSASTNDLGLTNLIIGQGTVNTGDFSSINWGDHTFFVKVELDLGSGFLDMGTTQLVSVPYSLYAKKAEEVDLSINELTDVSSPTPANGEVLKWDGSSWKPSPDNVSTGGGAVNTTARITGDGSPGNPIDLAQQSASTGELLKWNGTTWSPSADNVTDADADSNNELQTLSISGSDISLSNGGGTVTVPSTPTYSGGTGISVSGTTITNTAPDQTVGLTGSGSTSVSGSYPNFTISSTDNNTTYSAGTGISLSGTTINNAAPDQTVALTGTGATSISGTYPSFTISSTDNVNDADANPSNEIQSLSISGSDISLSNGGGTVTVPTGASYTGGSGIDVTGTTISNTSPDQTVSLTGSGATSISGTYPNFTVSSTDNVNDADADSNNELQNLSISGSDITLSNGGGTVTVPTGPSYTGGSGIDVSGTTISNTSPDQTVSLSGSGATSISGTYPNFTVSSTDNVNDADANPSNEIQSLSISGSDISLSNGGGTVTVPTGASYSGGTGIDVTGTTISNTSPDQTVSLTGSGATSISGTYPNFTVSSTDNVNDADASTTNEIQSMSLSGNTLSLSLGGGSVSLASFGSPWNNSGSNLYFNTGKVGIGDNSPIATLTVGNGDKFQVHGADGDVVFKDDQGSIRFANSNGSNAPMIQMFQSGTNNSTRMLLAHSPSFSNWGIQYNDTADAFNWVGDNLPVFHVQLSGGQRVGVGTFAPEAKFHVVGDSWTGGGHVKLTETQFDYSRITMNNDIHSNFWDIAARTDTNLANAQMNIYHSNVGDILSVNARGRIGINDASPSYALEINGKQSTRIMNLYNTLPTTTNTTYNYGLRCNLSQSNNTGFPRLYNVYAISTDNDAYLTYGLYGYASGASSNNYGIYAYAPTSSGYAGYFNGNTYCTGSYLPSDRRLKSDIEPLTAGLATVMALRPKTYHYDREGFDFLNLPEGEQFGFIAQDIEALSPNLTAKAFQAYDEAKSNTAEGQGFEFKAINYTGLIPVMVSAMQEQQTIIDDQEKKIESLEKRLEALEKIIKR